MPSSVAEGQVEAGGGGAGGVGAEGGADLNLKTKWHSWQPTLFDSHDN
jgi:hypothetical protein